MCLLHKNEEYERTVHKTHTQLRCTRSHTRLITLKYTKGLTQLILVSLIAWLRRRHYIINIYMRHISIYICMYIALVPSSVRYIFKIANEFSIVFVSHINVVAWVFALSSFSYCVLLSYGRARPTTTTPPSHNSLLCTAPHHLFFQLPRATHTLWWEGHTSKAIFKWQTNSRVAHAPHRAAITQKAFSHLLAAATLLLCFVCIFKGLSSTYRALDRAVCVCVLAQQKKKRNAIRARIVSSCVWCTTFILVMRVHFLIYTHTHTYVHIICLFNCM